MWDFRYLGLGSGSGSGVKHEAVEGFGFSFGA